MRPDPKSTLRRRGVVLRSSFLPLVLLGVGPDGLSDFVRRSVVRGAQTADKIDGVWQKFAADLPGQLRPPSTGLAPTPSAVIDGQVGAELLELPMLIGAKAAKVSREDLEVKVLKAEQEAAFLYKDDFTWKIDGGERDPSSSAYFAFRSFATWRALSDALPTPAERRAFTDQLGEALLAGPLAPSVGAASAPVGACAALLSRLERAGLIRQFVLNDNSLDEDVLDAAAARGALPIAGSLRGAATNWDYLVSGSVLAAASQLSLLRGPGEFSPAQGLIVAPLTATLKASLSTGSKAEVIEYFVDPRFSADPKFDAKDYTQSLITLTVQLPDL